MTSRTEADLVKRLRAFVSTAAVFSMVFGLSGLAGWVLNLPALATWGDETAMAPNAAACFLLAGLDCSCWGKETSSPLRGSGK
jgi:hypothetical protein